MNITSKSNDAYRFKTIGELTDVLSRGAEIEFEWKGVEYSLTPVDGRCFSRRRRSFTTPQTAFWSTCSVATSCVML